MIRWAQNSTTLSEFESLLHQVFEKARKYITLQAVHKSDFTFVCTAPRWVMNVLKRMVRMGERVLSKLGVIQITIEGEPVFLEVKPVFLEVKPSLNLKPCLPCIL